MNYPCHVDCPLVQAKYFTATDGRQVDLLVVHDAEFPELLTAAEDVAAYFQRITRPASAHACFDANSCVQCVRDRDVAYAAPGANHNGWHAEFAGYASQRPKDWADDFSTAMLELAAEAFADKAERYRIPVKYRTAAQLRAGMRGITTHAQITLAFHESTHTDPGVNFPMDRFVQRIRAHYDRPGVEIAEPLKLIRIGAEGWEVKRAERRLHVAGYFPGEPDRKFTESTERAVKRFQREHNLNDDGVIGPATWATLRAAA